MKKIDGNVASAKGFRAAGGYAGIKKITDDSASEPGTSKKDMALITSVTPATAAGCFTTNRVKAAPVIWDMGKIVNRISGIVVNSGNANACTGEQGLKDAEETAEKLASLEGVEAENILVCSTGIIGVNLPMDKILQGIEDLHPALSDSPQSAADAAEAIMTTDTYMKTAAAEIDLGGKKVTIGGMAKGSGMINPNMATMLCFITTDCAISRPMLSKALTQCAADSFNMICVDGDMSTNDTVICLANAMAENKEITEENEDFEAFRDALMYVCKTLAIKCADDGEGATKLIEANVSGAIDTQEAKKLALSVVSSSLLKAAMFGQDANWGRVLCAMGYSGAEFDPMNVTLEFRSEKGSVRLTENGMPVAFDEDKAYEILSEHKIYIDIFLSEGDGQATAWGCDLTYDYVKINGEYRG